MRTRSILASAIVAILASIGLEASAQTTVCSQGADYTSAFQALNGAPAGDDILFCRGEEFEVGYVILSHERSETTIGAYGEGEKPVLVGKIGLSSIWGLRFEDLRFEPAEGTRGIALYAWYSVGSDLVVSGCEFGDYAMLFGVRVPGNYDQEIDISFFSDAPLFTVDENGNYIPNGVLGLDDLAFVQAALATRNQRADINGDGVVGLDDFGIILNAYSNQNQ